MRYFSAVAGLFALLCVLTTQHALAFQQQSVGGPVEQSSKATSEAPPSKAGPLQELVGSSSADKAKPRSEGRRISIPGLGTVGVLPKMDFGLELLYGNKGSEQVVREPEEDETNDLRIRGSIKHRF